ncbi:DsbE family thiol:disulfide interchange protein [Hahella sp. SMD15-11]|uniref:DsbE family thiol:disulfide interchange protein n=1 Tax=Thermohahella caldifontis TaxID=3142973 RepID=A0AB39UXX2_9GAMM
MNRRVLLFIPLILFVGLFILFNWGMDQDLTQLELARKDKPVPAFRLPDLIDPAVMHTEQELKGKVTLLNVWATWCPTCRVEHPYLLRIRETGLVRLVGLDYKDDRGAALKWLRDLGDPYDLHLFDEEGRFGLDLGVYGAPETYLIDAQGIVRYRHVGAVDDKVWQTILLPKVRQYSQENGS